MSTSSNDQWQPDIVVIGAGLGGLATASLLAQRGKRVLVIDRHNVPGGYATNFTRKGFTFDVSLHSFDGVIAGAHSFECIKACGVADRVTFLPHKRLYRFVSREIDLSVSERDLDSYKRQLSLLFPDESANIDRLFAEAQRTYADVAGFLYARLPFWLRLLATPFLFHRILRYENTSVHGFFSKFTRNERLKGVLAAQWTYYGLPPQQLAFPYFSYPFIDYLRHGGYSVKGGSQELSNALRAVIEENGGQVVLSSPVTKIHTDGKRVTGISSKKTGFVRTRRVIANISPFAVRELIGADFPKATSRRLDKARSSISAFQVYLGLDCSLQKLGVSPSEYIVFKSDNPDLPGQYQAMQAGNVAEEASGWSLNFFSNVDPTLAPPGKSTLGIFTLLGAEGWHGLSKSAYRTKKLALTQALIRKAESVLPGLSNHIEVCEAGSPHTLNKFTANPQGCIYGFEQSIHQSGLMRRFPQRYPIKGLFHVGAWTFPGAGFIGTLLSARILVDRYFGGWIPRWGRREIPETQTQELSP
jgi:prolycopene isomerase